MVRYNDIAGTTLILSSVSGYDQANRLTSLTHRQGASTPIVSYTWSFDRANRISGRTGPDGTTSYDYDAAGQMEGATPPGQAAEAFSYDKAGNRTNSGYQTGVDNRLSSEGRYNYTYDKEGNRTQRTDTVTGNVVHYTWDQRNRLVRVQTTTGAGVPLQVALYTFDMGNRRIGKPIDAVGSWVVSGEWLGKTRSHRWLDRDRTGGGSRDQAGATRERLPAASREGKSQRT